MVLLVRDVVAHLQHLLDCPRMARPGAFALRAAPAFAGGQRVFTHPMNGDFALQMQELLPPGTHPLLIQFYSDKTNVFQSAGAGSVYPVIISILNTEAGLRDAMMWEGVVAYLPVLKKVAGLSAAQLSRRNMEVLAAGLEVVMAPLKAAGRGRGLRLRVPGGELAWLMPLLACYLADYPEARQVAGLYASGACAHPCTNCLVTPADLHHTTLQWQSRSPALMDQWRQQARSGPAAAKAVAMHPTDCPLQGFFGCYTAPGAPVSVRALGRSNPESTTEAG